MLTGRRDGIGASLPRWIIDCLCDYYTGYYLNVAAVVREFFVTKENPMMQSWRHSAYGVSTLPVIRLSPEFCDFVMKVGVSGEEPG